MVVEALWEVGMRFSRQSGVGLWHTGRLHRALLETFVVFRVAS
jgi:hypothetical protein